MSYKTTPERRSFSNGFSNGFFDGLFQDNVRPSSDKKADVEAIYADALNEEKNLARRFRFKAEGNPEKFDGDRFSFAVSSVEKCIEADKRDDMERVRNHREARIPEYIQGLRDGEYASFEDLYAEVFGTKLDCTKKPAPVPAPKPATPTPAEKAAAEAKAKAEAEKKAKAAAEAKAKAEAEAKAKAAAEAKAKAEAEAKAKAAAEAKAKAEAEAKAKAEAEAKKATSVAKKEIILLSGKKTMANLYPSKKDPDKFLTWGTKDGVEVFDSQQDALYAAVYDGKQIASLTVQREIIEMPGFEIEIYKVKP